MTSACWLLSLSPLLCGQSETRDAVRTIHLQIDDRRYTYEHLDEGIAVDVGGPGAGIDLSVGAAISARRIDVRLRRVDGLVRYRLSAAKVLAPIRARAR